MNRNRISIAAILVALAVTSSIAATVKTGAVCPSPVVAKKIQVKPKASAKPVKPQPKALPRLLDLGSATCIPCKMMSKVLDELKTEYKGKLQVDFIDVKKDTAAVSKYKVRVIPLQIFYDAKGKELFRHEGYYPKADIVKKFNQLGINLAK